MNFPKKNLKLCEYRKNTLFCGKMGHFSPTLDGYKERGMRKRLLETLRKKGISDERTLEAMGRVPRHFFLENAFLCHAYEDKAFPIGEGQTISQPFTVAFQTELLNIKPRDKVLEIGTGSGYQAAVLLEMGATVYTIEYNKTLFEKTRDFLPTLGYTPFFICGDGSKGLPTRAPFNKIIVTAGAPFVPPLLCEQLANEGCLVIPVGSRDAQCMTRITKKNNKLVSEKFNNFAFVPLLGNDGWGNR